MKILFNENLKPFLLILAVWCMSFYYLLELDKGDVVLWFNGSRNDFLDVFFVYATKFGEPLAIVLINGLVLFFNWRKGVFLSIALVCNTIIVQVLKKLVFDDHMRPLHHLRDKLSLIQGLDVHSSFSFPSGHTTGGFTLFFVLCLLINNQMAKLTFILLGIVVAISRIYLSQHFLEDVVAASVISAFTSLLYYKMFNKSKIAFL